MRSAARDTQVSFKEVAFLTASSLSSTASPSAAYRHKSMAIAWRNRSVKRSSPLTVSPSSFQTDPQNLDT